MAQIASVRRLQVEEFVCREIASQHIRSTRYIKNKYFTSHITWDGKQVSSTLGGFGREVFVIVAHVESKTT